MADALPSRTRFSSTSPRVPPTCPPNPGSVLRCCSGFSLSAGLLDDKKGVLPEKMEGGYHALGVMETHLSANEFFVAGRYSVADIALYAYTHVAHEGDFDLGRFPSVTTWLDRVGSQPRHVCITDQVGKLVPWP